MIRELDFCNVFRTQVSYSASRATVTTQTFVPQLTAAKRLHSIFSVPSGQIDFAHLYSYSSRK